MTVNTNKFATYLLVVCVFCVGMYAVPQQMMTPRLENIPGGLADSRLNNYFLGGYDHHILLTHDVQPGATVALDAEVLAPLKPGCYFLEFDMVQDYVAWFHDKGSPTLLIKVDVN